MYYYINVCNHLYRKFMKEKNVADEKIVLQAGDFFKTIPKFEWVINNLIHIIYAR